MKFFRKHSWLIFLLAGFFIAQPVFSQKETKAHKRMWWRFGLKKHRDGFNPSVEHGKATHEQSRKQKREDARIIKRQKKEYKKQQRKSKRKAGLK